MNSRNSVYLFVIFLLLLGLLACSPTLLPVPTGAAPPPLTHPSTSISATAPPASQPTTAGLAHPQISLRAGLDYAAHRLSAQETITYPNHTGIALPYLAFDVLAARQAGVFTWIRGQVQDDPAAAFSLAGTALRVTPSRPLAPGASAVVTVQYTLDLPEIALDSDASLGVLGWSAHQTNLIDWFPAVSAYRDGWAAERNKPHVVGETTAPEATDMTVDLDVNGAPADLKIIASAPEGEAQASGRHHFELPGARSFAVSLSTSFKIAQTSTASGVVVRSAYLPEHSAAGRAALQTTAAALEVYGAHYGPYRYRQISIVEADFLDGMEYSGLYFLGRDYYAQYDGTPRNYLTAIAAHETAHQWWYGDVGNDQAREPWLDEALSTYSESVYYQATYPELVNWWWNFRVMRFKPAGRIDASVYDFQAFRPYVNAVYLRGALYMRDLRSVMGDRAFFDFMRRYHAEQSGRVATAGDFWAALQAYDVPQLAGLRAAYFSPTGQY